MSITSEYRKMHQSKNLNENTYQDINDIIKDFQGRLDPFIIKKDLNIEIKFQLKDLNNSLDKFLKGDLYSLRTGDDEQ